LQILNKMNAINVDIQKFDDKYENILEMMDRDDVAACNGSGCVAAENRREYFKGEYTTIQELQKELPDDLMEEVLQNDRDKKITMIKFVSQMAG